MILTASSSSVKESRNSRLRYSDSPPSYVAVEAEPHGFIDGKAPRVPPLQHLPAPPVSRGPSTLSRSDPLTPNRMPVRNSEPNTVYLDPTGGDPRAAYMVSDALLAQCTQFGHVEKTKFGALSIIAAAVFFPWGLICLMGNRVVYCDRCGLVLRGPRECKVTRRVHSHKRGRY
ncbi:hypothetical protein BJ322DRAFT_131576 [Thelephora terrestris]|uniref:Brain protein I3 n=1 Tax=Thelephora terrestris TaxID=56493 RepID=A0A9P6LCJ8_9AGAM|nr:hypothetical protein BJ322DRAFT_131576 [Thelephora terrestris]